jgi:hypothetical protein
VDIDGAKEIVEMPADFATRRYDIYWNYSLPKGVHTMKIHWLNPVGYANVRLDKIIVYTGDNRN